MLSVTPGSLVTTIRNEEVVRGHGTSLEHDLAWRHMGVVVNNATQRGCKTPPVSSRVWREYLTPHTLDETCMDSRAEGADLMTTLGGVGNLIVSSIEQFEPMGSLGATVFLF